MRAIGYFREPSYGGRTPAEQNKAFLEFCAREGHDGTGTFVDSAATGGEAPGFRQLLLFVRDGLTPLQGESRTNPSPHGERSSSGILVVVQDVGAFGGVLRDASRRYFQLAGLGASVVALEGERDIAEDILAAWRAQEGGHAGDRVRIAMRRKAVKGEVLGRPPYGYKVGSQRRLEVIPEEAVVVRYIYRLYLNEDLGIRLIARRLNQEDLKTRRGGNWSMVSIRDILRNRVYLGTYSRFGVKVPGSHTALVSADDFRAAQDRLSARRTSHAPRVASQFLLSGIVQCGYCGNKLIGVSRKQAWQRRSGERVSNSYRYYQCESRTNQSVCSYHTRRAADLETQVCMQLAEMFASGAGFADDPDAAEVRSGEQVDRERLHARMKSIDRRLDGYIDAASKGRITKERMEKLSVTAAADRLAIEDVIELTDRRLSRYGDRHQRRDARNRDLVDLLAAWEETPFAARHAGLREAITRVTVTDDDNITIALRA